MRLVYFGTPLWAVPPLEALAASEHQVAGVVCNPDRPAGRRGSPVPCPVKARSRELGLAPILQPATLRPTAARRAILALEADVFVVVAYGRILPGRLIDAPPHGAVNLHFSLLPRHRGASPVQHAILRGDGETGVTTMKMDRGLDTGPILLQVSTPIGPEETTAELGSRLADIGARLLLETLDGLAAGRITPRSQDEDRATLAPLLDKNAGRFDWEESAEAIARRVRALGQWPKVRARGARGVLLLRRVRPADETPPKEALPGTVLGARGEAVAVVCGAGSVLWIQRLQPEGRREMDGAAALAGGYLASGGRLSVPAP
ncbi:MAG: methionyl-tRNA formyltransferase [Acidobacteriota bacterium]|nr:methionyl-tRNA formyltransferase [Acidobacteriota bacterium]MDQ7088079.1 methionyl-tRNA formyltransferase [Acidobacteriota bacterium]